MPCAPRYLAHLNTPPLYAHHHHPQDALNLLFLAVPLLNVALPFVYKSFPFIFSADCLLMAVRAEGWGRVLRGVATY